MFCYSFNNIFLLIFVFLSFYFLIFLSLFTLFNLGIDAKLNKLNILFTTLFFLVSFDLWLGFSFDSLNTFSLCRWLLCLKFFDHLIFEIKAHLVIVGLLSCRDFGILVLIVILKLILKLFLREHRIISLFIWNKFFLQALLIFKNIFLLKSFLHSSVNFLF